MTIEPLVPPEVDLRDFAFTPMYRARLFGSAFHARATDAEWRAGVTLWLKAQDQVPAGSLPNDDVELCRLAELGRDVKSWRKIRDGALHGWTEAVDGRLYNSVVAEVVLEQWQSKIDQRNRTLKGRIAAIEKRLSQTTDEAVKADLIAQIQRLRQELPQSLSQTPKPHVTDPVTEPVTASKRSKGTGTVKGQGYINGGLTPSYGAGDLEIAKSLWNEAAGELGFSSVAMLTEPRKKALALRLGELGGIDGWRIMLEIIGKSPHLLGENDRGWKVFFDWVLKPTNLTKVMENTYVRAPKLSNWDIAGAVLSEQDRLEGLREKGGPDDLHALPEPEGRS